MVSTFIRATFLNFTPNDGLCRTTSYLFRTRVEDKRLQCIHDFQDIADDLVYGAILLPKGSPSVLNDLAALANAADLEEIRHIRTFDRRHWPQICGALVVALPPDDELTFDEARELLGRIVEPCARGRVTIIVLHDPALVTKGERNRHAHVLILVRQLTDAGFGKKIRELFARLRLDAGGRPYVAEGVHWPRLSFELQQYYFAELGTDIVVNPPAPFSERHWSSRTRTDDPDRVERHRRAIRNSNREMIYGAPDKLVDRMLCGRGAMPVAELDHLLNQFLDADSDQRLDEILVDPDIVTFAQFGERRPSRLTTQRVNKLMQQAVGAVDRAAKAIGTVSVSRLSVVLAADGAAVDREIATRVDLLAPLLIGSGSDCNGLAQELAPLRPTTASVASMLASLTGEHAAKAFGARSIVMPRVASIDDQSLAAIILAAEDRQAGLVLGYDLERRGGVAGGRLAAYAADALAPVLAGAPGQAERELRAGLVDRAVVAMHAQNQLRFAADETNSEQSWDFFVCDEQKRVDQVNDRLSAAPAPVGAESTSIEVDLAGGRAELTVGRWIAITKTDYSVRPPRIRKGQLARITALDPSARTADVKFADGTSAEIDLSQRPPLRPAFAVSIREARMAPAWSNLFIELTQPKRAWSCLLLAASRLPDRCVVRVDPAVAGNVDELSRVVRSSLPAALPQELIPKLDPEAGIDSVLCASSVAEMQLPEAPSIDLGRVDGFSQI